MRALHLFDYYLPTTLNWVSYLLRHLPDVRVEIGAPWIIRGEFWAPSFREYRYPFQLPGLFDARTELDYTWVRRLFTRSQRFLPTYAHWLSGRIHSSPPDVLHAHFGPVGCRYLPVALRLRRPLVVTFYGFDYESILNRRPELRRQYQQLFRQAACIVVASPFGAAQLKKWGCPSDKIAFIAPAPDLSFFAFRGKQKPSGRLRLVQVATFTPKKGHLTTLEAVRLARPHCPGLHLTLAGERHNVELCREIAHYLRQHRLEGCVSWLPAVPHGQMPAFLADFDAVIHPSRYAADGDHEASPLALLEAQAMGLPVLATRHADFPLLVRDGQTGVLVEEGDAAALAEVICRFYNMAPAEYEGFSRRARTHVEQHFDVRRSAENLRALYASLV